MMLETDLDRLLNGIFTVTVRVTYPAPNTLVFYQHFFYTQVYLRKEQISEIFHYNLFKKGLNYFSNDIIIFFNFVL